MSIAPYDPVGEVPITNKLITVKPKSMLNHYRRIVKVGGGQHGTVYLCLKQRKNASDLAVAMKSVKRVNLQEEKYRLLKHGQIPRSPRGVSVADRVNLSEKKIRKEIAIMKKLRHPHVVRLYEVIDDRMREKIYIVMEYLGGGEVLWQDDQKPLLTVGQTRRIMRDALLGLEYLHYQGIIHRDIKPANLLYTDDRSHVKIGDFGVSHFSYAQRLAAVGTDAANAADQNNMDPILLDDSALTMRAGTPVFLAPEVIWEYRHLPATSSTSLPPMNGQFSSLFAATEPSSDSESGPTLSGSRVPSSVGKPLITKAIDVWALGITFLCLLTGRLPYNASKNEWALYNKIANENIRLSDTLGADKLPTGVRRTIDGEKGKQDEGEGEEEEEEKGLSKHEGKKKAKDMSEGPVIFALLERFLQRDPANRIKLEEVKFSKFILTGVPNVDDWLFFTSPTTPPILVDSADTSQAMTAVRFRADWGTRLVRQFSSFWSRHGSSTRNPIRGSAHAPVPSLRHMRSLKAAQMTSTPFHTAIGKQASHAATLGRSGTVSGVTGRQLNAAVTEHGALKSSPDVLLPNGHGPWLRKSKKASPSQHSSQASPVERKSLGWWRRNVASILRWSPDRYSHRTTFEKELERQWRREEKEKKRQNKQGWAKSNTGNEEWYRDVILASDAEAEAEYDPLQTSKTFDSYTPPMEVYKVPWSMHNGQYDDDGDETLGKGYYAKDNPVSRDSSTGAILPPTTRWSEEAFGRYLPSPASAEGDHLFTNARRASSWGQGDKANYEIQSISSDLAPPEATLGGGERPQVMWRESERLYVMENGVLVPVSTSADDGETVSHSATCATGGPGPSTAKHRAVRAGTATGDSQGNVQRLTPILDGCSSCEPSDFGFGNGGPSRTTRQQRSNRRHDMNYEKAASSEDEDDEDDESSDHGLTFAPGRRSIRQ